MPPPILNLTEPRRIASFCLGLGYEADNVARALVTRCGLDETEAARVVADVASTTTERTQP